MDQIVTALTQEQIKAMEAAQQVSAPKQPEVAQVPPTGFADASGRTKTVTLEWPLEVDGKTIASVELRRLVGRDFQQLTKLPAGTDENSALLHLMTGLPSEVIGQLDADDFVSLSEAARAFLPRRLIEALETQTSETGTPSQQ